MNLHESLRASRPFTDPDEHFGAIDSEGAALLALGSGDLALCLNDDGIIIDLASSGEDLPELSSWIGMPLIDTVTVESRSKIIEMLDAGPDIPRVGRWRQINHVVESGELPMRYRVLPLANSNRMLAIGRDMRPWAALQQRLLRMQQSLERDYLRLRQAEARYRMLFDMGLDPKFVVSAHNRRIVEANLAAHSLAQAKPGSLRDTDLIKLFDPDGRDSLIAHLGAAPTSVALGSLETKVLGSDDAYFISVVPFRQDGQQLLIVRLTKQAEESRHGEMADLTLQAVENLPDAFVLTNDQLAIEMANGAMIEMLGAASLEQIKGQPLSVYLGRPGIDLELIRKQLDEHGVVRNAGTLVRSASLAEEQVELSAVRSDSHGGHYAFVIRTVGRRLRDLPPVASDVPRSVDQLTDLVGRMPLKEIVRESTDLIERMCIESALTYTSNNRASAAEILGLSRQSLYSKLHRHGLGNLNSKSD